MVMKIRSFDLRRGFVCLALVGGAIVLLWAIHIYLPPLPHGPIMTPIVVDNGPKKGDKAIVAYWMEVVVKNPEPITDHAGRWYHFNEQCGIAQGNPIKVIAVEGDYLLVQDDSISNPFGTTCPFGTLFFVHKNKFVTMTDEYNNHMAAEEVEKTKIRALIGK